MVLRESTEKALGESSERVEDDHMQCVLRGHCVKFWAVKALCDVKLAAFLTTDVFDCCFFWQKYFLPASR